MPIAPPETEIVTVTRVACDGNEGALGHPRVWLSIPQDIGWVECGYCDKKFIHADFVGGNTDGPTANGPAADIADKTHSRD